LQSGVWALIVDYLKRHGRDAEARPHIDNLTAAGEMEMEARKERSRIQSSDKLLPHGLPADRLQALAAQLADQEQLLKAYLVRKQTRYYPDVPMYVLAVERRRRWWMPESIDAPQKFVDQLFEAITPPGDMLVVSIEDRSARSRFSKVAESLIYRRKK
jgi:hypothetical protein